jgi:hypothetical protein
MIRTSTIWIERPPMRWISPVSSTREQLDLGVERQLADLVEEQGRSVGSPRSADMAVESPVKAPFLVPEQHRFDEVLGDRAAIHGDHRLAAARGRAVDRLSDTSLPDPLSPSISTETRARAALAATARAERKGGAEPTISSKASGRFEIFSDSGRSSPPPRWRRSVAALSAASRLSGRDRLDQEIVGSGPHRLDRDGDRGLGRHDEQRQIGTQLPDLLDHAGAVGAGKPMVEEDRVDRRPVDLEQDLGRRVDVGRAADPPAGAGADGGDEPPLSGLVVYQQQASRRVRPHLHSPWAPWRRFRTSG